MITLDSYLAAVSGTDQISDDDLDAILMGLFGEVGEVMAAAKKVRREGTAYIRFDRAAVEEFGDVFWYFSGLCRRLSLPLSEILADATSGDGHRETLAASGLEFGALARILVDQSQMTLPDCLVDLGRVVSELVTAAKDGSNVRTKATAFAKAYLLAVQRAGFRFSDILEANVAKVRGRFLPPDFASLPTFDGAFPIDEQLPWQFEIEISQKRTGRSYLRWNGVFIGDPLTDNIADPDGYRFHDVFHFGFAAILHWSPTFRALIKHKRKSDPKVDEAQDSGRAIVVEEGLSAWIFSYAKEVGFFVDQGRVSFDLLKTIQEFVRGYEVEAVPLWMWQKAILDGYAVFRQVRDNGGGVVICDRQARSISYRPLKSGEGE